MIVAANTTLMHILGLISLVILIGGIVVVCYRIVIGDTHRLMIDVLWWVRKLSTSIVLVWLIAAIVISVGLLLF